MNNIKSWLAIGVFAAVSLATATARADPASDAEAGLTALNQGDNANAIRLFSQAIGSGGLSKADLELAYVKRAESYLAAGNQASALADANSALALDANDTEAAGVRDKAQVGAEFSTALQSGDPIRAIYLFTKAIESGGLSKSDLELAYLKRAEHYWEMRNALRALADAQSALAIDPSNTEAASLRDTVQPVAKRNRRMNDAYDHNNRGNVLFEQADWAGAIAEYQQANQLLPDPISADTRAAFAGNLNKAQNALAKDHNERGVTLYNQRDYGNALTQFQQAHQLSPDDAIIARNLQIDQTALDQAQAAQSQPAPQTQTSGACKVELAKAAVNIFGGIVALAKHESYQGPDVDSSQCDGQ